MQMMTSLIGYFLCHRRRCITLIPKNSLREQKNDKHVDIPVLIFLLFVAIELLPGKEQLYTTEVKRDTCIRTRTLYEKKECSKETMEVEKLKTRIVTVGPMWIGHVGGSSKRMCGKAVLKCNVRTELYYMAAV